MGYNASKSAVVAANMSRMIAFYNREAERFADTFDGPDRKAREGCYRQVYRDRSTKISWTRALKQELWRERPTLAFEVIR